MKHNPIYYLSILFVAVLIFIYSKSQSTQELPLENDRANSDSELLELPLRQEASTSTPTKYNLKELEGDYWNHPYVRETPENSDVALSLSLNDKNELEAQFLYYEIIDGEEWGVQREGGSTTLSRLSDSVLIVNNPIDPFVGDFLYIIETDHQIGLSLDGETIAYYSNQHILSELSSKVVTKYFYGNESQTEEFHVKFGGIKQFTELDRTYALVFFEEYYNEAQGSRYSSNAVVLSVAKFEKKEDGWHLGVFQEACNCGYNGHSNDMVIYPTLRKIGPKHFLFKQTQEENDGLNTNHLYIYEVENFREVLKVNLEQYQVNPLGKKEYTMKYRVDFPEDSTECAIILQDNSVAKDSISFELKQDIYFFDEENKLFEKAT